MKYGLSEKQLNELLAIVASQPEVEQVVLFGSRALGTYKEASDIDLAIKGSKVTDKTISRLKDAFEDSDLPFFVDVVNYQTIDKPKFKRHIDGKGVELVGGSQNVISWKVFKLKELTKKIGSGATPKGGSNSYKDFGISLIRSQNVLDIEFSDDGLVFIDEDQAKKLDGVTVLEGDILLNITGDSVARVCKAPLSKLPARVNQHVAIIRSDEEKASPDFILYFLIAIKPHLLSIAEIGGTRRALTKGMLEELDVLTPPLPEQKAIASVLSSLDDKIDLLHRQNKTLEAVTETLFRQWFVEAEGEGCAITDLVEFNPSRKLAKGTLAPYLEMAALSTDTFNPSGWYDREFSSGSKFTNGDTLLARITPCLENGKTAYVSFLAEGQIGWGSTEFIVMRPVESLHPLFAYILARNSDFRDYAEGCMAGSSGRQRVDISHLKQYEIVKPEEAQLAEFNSQMESIAPKLQANMMQINALENLRDTLLPKLISGEARVAL